MKLSIYFWGPQGTGKTRNAKIIADYFGLDRIVESEDFTKVMRPYGDLYISNVPLDSNPFNCQIITVEEMKTILGDKWVDR